MIKDFSIQKHLEKHARHVESAHRELSHHMGRLRESPTAGELFSLLSFQLRPRLSRHNEIKNCPKRGPAFAAKFPDHHTHGEESEVSLVKLIKTAEQILSQPKYYLAARVNFRHCRFCAIEVRTHEIDRDRDLDEEDQKAILSALQSELQ